LIVRQMPRGLRRAARAGAAPQAIAPEARLGARDGDDLVARVEAAAYSPPGTPCAGSKAVIVTPLMLFTERSPSVLMPCPVTRILTNLP
jgi:hypothetical protein